METCNVGKEPDKVLLILLDRATSISNELIDLQNRATDVTQKLAGGLRNNPPIQLKDQPINNPIIEDYCQKLSARFDVIEGTVLEIRREMSVLERVI